MALNQLLVAQCFPVCKRDSAIRELLSAFLPAPSPCLPLPPLSPAPRSWPPRVWLSVALGVYLCVLSDPPSPSLTMADPVPKELSLLSWCSLCPLISPGVTRWPQAPASAPRVLPAAVPEGILQNHRANCGPTASCPAPGLFSLHAVLQEPPPPPPHLEYTTALCGKPRLSWEVGSHSSPETLASGVCFTLL